MNNLLFAAGGQPAGSSNPILTFLPFILIFVIFYFLMIRPQAKKQKDKQRMLSNLKAGDEILTVGGIIGRIEGIREKDKILIVKIAKDVKINISQSAVADKIEKKLVN